MANRILSLFTVGLNKFHSLKCPNNLQNIQTVTNVILQQSNSPLKVFNRSTSFFNKLPAEDLWRGVTSVSNAGKKRGRGKGSGRRIAKNLNRGQVIGWGKENIVWPGLNAPIIRGKELVQQQKLPEDLEREKKILQIRDSAKGFRAMKINPIDRGWSGAKIAGRSIGPPDPVGEELFEGFDTRVLESKMVHIMKGNMGRKRRYSVLTITGNGNGLGGFAIGKSPEMRIALRKSKNRAAQKLLNIELFDGHTVFHDFYCAFGTTKIFVSQKPEGYGLVCHRAIQTICKVLGIKNLHAKIEGSTNLQHIVKAFFIGLLQQKTYQQIAEEKQLYVVMMQKECGGLPRVLAAPTVCRTSKEIKRDEVLDFTQYVLGDRIILKRKKFPPFYVNTKGYELYLKKREMHRNHPKVRLNMLVHEGEERSFLTDKYPECRMAKWTPRKKEVE